MIELRKDYILDEYVLLALGRGQRPQQFKKNKASRKVDVCYFCPGNEHMTPPETYRLGDDKNWQVRVFPNKFPAVQEEGNAEIRTDNNYFTFASAYGKHEVIVESPDHEKDIVDLPVDHIKSVLEVYSHMTTEYSKLPNVKYVHIFKNQGAEAGTSLVHTHTQLVAYNKIPKKVMDEINACKNYDHCPYCDIIDIEKGSDRKVFENDTFISFTPYASKNHFEIWLFPKRHVKSITQLEDSELTDMASMLKQILERLKTLNAPFNYYLHYAPSDHDLHFHVEICPRLSTWAGFELGSGDIINSVNPEMAAEFYRGDI